MLSIFSAGSESVFVLHYTYNFYENMSNFYFDPPTLFWKKKSLITNKKYTGWPKLMKNKIQDGFRQLHVCRNEYA